MYGSIIKILSSESKYDNKIFFVERVDDTELCLITEENTKEILEIENGVLTDDNINSITIIYKPLLTYDKQHNLFIKQWVEIEFDDGTNFKGQIINITTHIEIKLKDTTIYVPIDRGLPKGILKIKRIAKPINYDIPINAEIEEEPKEDDFKELEENEIIGYIEQEEEGTTAQYYYSIEQQTSDLLEHLIVNIPEEKRSPFILKSFQKIIQRYKELRNKYTEFENGIKINKLPLNQLLNTTLKLKNKTFMPLTKDIEVYLYNTESEEEEESLLKEYFTLQEDNEFITRILKSLNTDIKYSDKIPLYNELINNYIIHKRVNPKKLLFLPDSTREVLLYDKDTILNKDRYTIKINEPISVHSLISYPLAYIQNLKTSQTTSNIIEKSNYGVLPYYSYLYNSIQNNVKESSPNNYLINNRVYVYYENQTNSFDKYIDKIVPTLKQYIEIGLEKNFITPFYNFYSAIKNLEYINITELNKLDYIQLKQFINIANDKYKKNMIIPGFPKKNNVLYTPNISLEQIIKLYEDILPKNLENYFYSSSELLKYTNIDHNKYYFKTFVNNVPPTLITEEEIKEVKDEIESMIDKEEVAEIIHKVYRTEQEKENDKLQKIILKNVDGMTGLEYIYQQLLQLNIMNSTKITFDKLKKMVDLIIFNNLNIEMLKTNKELSIQIIQLINEIKIIDNNLAYVEESKKTYKRVNNEWIALDDPRCFNKKKLVSVKGDCKKESEYSDRVRILLDKIVEKREREKTSNATEKEIMKDFALQILMSYNNKYLNDDLKYNIQKEQYAILEVQKEGKGALISPYFKLRDKILNESRLEYKYKAIQIFINKYTKSGPDKYWYYCVETSAKLIPTFFYKLANAYLISHNLEKVEDELCLDQGTLSDNGDKWVDKYSGYIIKNISFDVEEGFDSKGYKVVTRDVISSEKDKEIFSEDILEELEKDRYIKTLVTVICTYLGVTYTENDELYTFIDKTYKATNATSKDESTQKIMLLFSVIANVFVYIQTSPIKLKLNKPYPNCKFSFAGYPLTNDESYVDGLTYVACVIKKLSKGGEPWKVFSKMPEDTILSNLKKIIKQILLKNENIKQLIEKKRLTYVEESVVLYTKWNNFSPRLNPIMINDEHIRLIQKTEINNMDDLKDRITFLSYLVQKEINNKIQSIKPILTDTMLNPYLINACCNEDIYTYRYFLNTTGIKNHLMNIIQIKKPLRKLEKLLINQKKYFQANNTKYIPNPTNAFTEDTMYLGIIKWAETNPELLKSFDIPIPVLSKTDSLKNKIIKMKEQNIIINDDTFINLIQKSNTIITLNVIKEKIKFEEDELTTLLTNESKLKVYLDLQISLLLDKLKIYKNRQFKDIIQFNNTILDNKTNLIIGKKLEHYTHINQILYNKIQFLLFTLPEIIYSNKNSVQQVIQKHWNLAPVHNKDINDTVITYYNNLFEKIVNEEMSYTLKLINLDKYKNYIKIELHDQQIRNLLYYYIFLGILDEYVNVKIKLKTAEQLLITTYINTIIAIFEREDRLALNFDTTRVKYEINLSKKSETKIKTDYFKSLSKDSRRAEGVLKEHKLEKWGVGLQKGMFQYVKENYLKDKLDAQSILENIGIVEPDEPNMDEIVQPSMFDPLDDPAEYSSNVDEDYDNEIDENEGF